MENVKSIDAGQLLSPRPEKTAPDLCSDAPRTSRPLKLALLIAFPADPARPIGGVEAVSVSLIRGLAKIPGLDVHVVTLNQASNPKEPLVWEGATLHRLPPPSGPLLAFAVGRGRRQIRDFLRLLQPDVVHAHDTYGIMVKGLPMPRVFTVHGFIHEDTRYAGGRFSWLRSRLWKWVETAAWADQPHIISISPYVRERLRGRARGVIHDIENPIAYECFKVPRRERPGTVFCAAAICERKNTLGLLRAYEILSRKRPGARLRWAGPVGDPACENSARRFIETQHLTDKAALLGPISSEQVRAELAQASVFALVSFEEGAPMGIAEAMAAAVPVVASNRCGMPYMVRDGETGFLVDPNDPADIAGRIEQILGDDALRARMGRRSAQTALELFHPDRVADRTYAVYRQASMKGKR
ncbi:MAG: glycosyltransferase family 4 protein [Verrucomicrobiota bacterium]|jgi:glycosyltransferase involved in cell wall biosynthesis